MSGLPPGFTLDQPAQQQPQNGALPPGFTVDQPAQAPQQQPPQQSGMGTLAQVASDPVGSAVNATLGNPGFVAGANTAMLGIPHGLAAAARALWNGTDVRQEYAKIGQEEQAAQAAHPYANIAGNIAGTIPAAIGAEAAIPANLAIRGGEAIAPLVGKLAARGAITGGIVGGAQAGAAGAAQGAQSGGVEDALAQGFKATVEGAATGVVGGAVLGPAAAGVTAGGKAAWAAFSGPSQKAIALIAKHLDEDPATVAQMLSDSVKSAGHPLNFGDILNAKSAANLSQATTRYQSSQAAMQAAADETTAARPALMAKQIANSGSTQTPFANTLDIAGTKPAPATVETNTARSSPLAALQESQMTAAIRPIADSPIMVDKASADFFNDPLVRSAYKSNPILAPRIGAMMSDLSAPDTMAHHGLTVQDFEDLRAELKGKQEMALNNNKPGLSSAYKELKNQIMEFTGAQNDIYKQAHADYARQGNFRQGFETGNDGKSPLDLPDPSDRLALATPEGKLGLEVGARTRATTLAGSSESAAQRLADTLRQMAPGAMTDSLPAPQTTALQKLGAVETRSAQNMATLSGGRLGSQQEDTARSAETVGRTALGLAMPTGASYKANIIHRWLTNLDVGHDTADEVVRIITSKDPKELASLPAKLTAAGVDKASQRKLLGAVAAYGGVPAGSFAAGAVNTMNEGQ